MGSPGNGGSTPSGLSNVKAIYSTEGDFAALKEDGTVWAWGDKSYGVNSVPSMRVPLRPMQPPNAPPSMTVTMVGITKDPVSLLQPEKAANAIFCTPFPMVKVPSRPEHDVKARNPILDTVPGITMEPASPEHPWNALSPMEVRPVGNSILFKDVQSWKALFGIVVVPI